MEIDGYHGVRMEGGWWRLCELEESYITDVKRSHYLPARHLDASLVLFGSSRETQKEIKGGGVQGLGLKPLHPCFKIKRATDKG